MPDANESADLIKSHLARVMRGFEPSPEDDPGFAMVFGRPCYKFEVDDRRLPISHIIRVLMIYLGTYDLGRGEKLAWEHTFRVDGTACSIASQKFGLRLYIDRTGLNEQEAEVFRDRVTRSLAAGQRIIEREVLRPISADLIRHGQVTVRNQYGLLRHMYDYFREGATLSYAGNGRLPRTHPKGGYWLAPDRQEGWWNTFAMVTAYFSLLEHFLVGALPFASYDPAVDNVTEFIGNRWGEKFKRIFNLGNDREADRHYSALHRISEQYRNTYGHGGFDKAGATVAFQLPEIGAIPAILSDLRDSPHFNFVPVADTDFSAICAAFDSIDQWLAQGTTTENAWKWITGGMDFRFDPEFRALLREAERIEDFDGLLRYLSYHQDQIDNMEW